MNGRRSEEDVNREPTIVVRKLGLRNVQTARELFNFLNDNRADFQLYGGIESHQFRNLKSMEKIADDPNTTEYGIFLEGGQLIGNVTFMVNKRPRNTAQISILVHPAHRRKNIASRAMEEVIRRQGRRDLKAIYASAHPNNHASHSLFEKLGFQRIEDFPDGHLAFKYIPKSD